MSGAVEKFVGLLCRQVYTEHKIGSFTDSQALEVQRATLRRARLDVRAIEREVRQAALEATKLAAMAEQGGGYGIGHGGDLPLGTNHHVFSILGLHTAGYYGDITLVFSPALMHHPDFNVTPMAATTFNRQAAHALAG